jgi:hypothetical protein
MFFDSKREHLCGADVPVPFFSAAHEILRMLGDKMGATFAIWIPFRPPCGREGCNTVLIRRSIHEIGYRSGIGTTPDELLDANQDTCLPCGRAMTEELEAGMYTAIPLPVSHDPGPEALLDAVLRHRSPHPMPSGSTGGEEPEAC